MSRQLLSYQSTREATRTGSTFAMAAWTCCGVCLLEVAYFWLWVLVAHLPDPPEFIGYLGCLTIPALVFAAIVCALVSRRDRERFDRLAIAAAGVASLAAISFAWKLIDMVFFTPW